jgi:signal transduction histidine kinase
LPAGKYTFYVKTPDNTQQKTLTITVNQVFWKSVWFWAIISLITLFIIWYAQRGYYKAQVNEREAELKKMKAIEIERERIAHDMHDDLGSGLTAISYLSQSTSDDSNKKIQEKSRELIKNMSEIIWSMKSENDSITELISYVKSYASYYCEENNLEINFDVKLKNENLQLNGDFRKNIYLIVKESLHNIVKHAKANKVVITFDCSNILQVTIQDNGIGINFENIKNGNGIKNIKNRIAKMNGTIEFKIKNGTTTLFTIPIAN